MNEKRITKRMLAAYGAFVAPAFGRDVPEIPKQRAKSRDLEHKEQSALIRWWSLQHHHFDLPEYALFCIPNGGSRHMLTAVRLKAEGVRPGIPDLCLAVARRGYNGAFIEMKAKDGVESAAQKEVRIWLNGQRYESVVCYGAEEAISFIKSYLGE